MSTWRENVDAHLEVVGKARLALETPVAEFIDCAKTTLLQGGKLLVAGNGGSAADAQHFVAELVGRFQLDRKALAALALTVDTSLLTAVANDLGYDRSFSRQVEALGRPGDILVAISTSGNSGNVLEAARVAAEMQLVVVTLTGRHGGRLVEHADISIRVPSDDVARIQEVHELVLHSVAESLESAACAG